MDVSTRTGDKVIFSNPRLGLEAHQKIAKKYLDLGALYTVEAFFIAPGCNSVLLQEVAGVVFNADQFDNCIAPEGGGLEIPKISKVFKVTIKTTWEGLFYMLAFAGVGFVCGYSIGAS